MSERERLAKEQKFLLESLKSGVITQEEFDKANKRVNDELEQVEDKTFSLEELNVKVHKPEVEQAEPVVEKEPEIKPVAPKPRKSRRWILWVVLVALLVWWCQSYTPEEPSGHGFTPFVEEEPGVMVNMYTNEACVLCEGFSALLETRFPGISIEEKSGRMFEYYPTYMFNSTEGLGAFGDSLEETDEGFVVKKESLKQVYFPGREQDGSLQVFLAPFSSSTGSVLLELQDLNRHVEIRFIGKDKAPEAGAMTLALEKELACLGVSALYCVIGEGKTVDECSTVACPDMMTKLEKDYADSEKLGITVSPSFVFNNQFRISGYITSEELEEMYCLVNDC